MKKMLTLLILFCLGLAGCAAVLAQESPAATPSPVPVLSPPARQTAAPAPTPPPAPSVPAEPAPTAAPQVTPPIAPARSARPQAPVVTPPAAPVSPAASPAIPGPVTPVPTAPAPATPPPATPEPVTPAPATPAPTPSPAPPVPSDEQVVLAYQRAEEAYGWFTGSPMPTSEETREVDGATYKKVDCPGIQNLTELRTYLRSLFSDEIVDRLLSAEGAQYVDLDGALYVLEGAGGESPDRGGQSRQVLREGEDSLSMQVTVETLDPESGAVTGTQTFIFPYERVGRKWIFTSFSLT